MSLLAIWRRTDEPGHDVVQLKQTDLGWHLNGAAVYLSDAGPARLDYTVQLAEDGRPNPAAFAGSSVPSQLISQ